MRLFNKIGDLMLQKVAPEGTASAACPPNQYFEYKCVQGRRRLRRRCNTLPTCTITCTSWTFDSFC